MAQVKKLDNLFHDTLKDIYYAERHILKAPPKMAKAAEKCNRSFMRQQITRAFSVVTWSKMNG